MSFYKINANLYTNRRKCIIILHKHKTLESCENMTKETLDNKSAIPLYQQMADTILKEIQNGTFSPGSRIPTEFELSESYHVSRVTVRKALAELAGKGCLERKSGKGTFVAEKKLQRGISSNVLSFTEICRMMGMKPGAKTIKIALENPSPKDAEYISLKPNEKIVVLERIRYANDKPVMLEINKYPESFSFLFGEDLTDTSLFDVLEKKYNIKPDHSSKVVDIVFANAKEAQNLNIAKGYPLLRIDSITHDADETLSYLSEQLCIGDRFKLII